MPVTVWKGQLTFGLVSIPIRIVRAARQERVRFTHVYRPEPGAIDSSESEEPDPEHGRSEPPAVLYPALSSPPVSSPPVSSPSLSSPSRSSKLRTMPSQAARVARTEETPAQRDDRRTDQLTPEPATPVERVRHQYADADTGERVAPRDVLKGYEYEKGRFAVFRPDEMRQFRAETTRDMEILEFVKLEQIDPLYFNASYYVAPDRGGEKPYSLLFEAMRRSGYAAIARFAMHGREQIVVIRPGNRGIVMHTLFFASEAHEDDEFTADPGLVTPQEMKLAELLISQLATNFDASKYKDQRLARIQASIDAKIAGGRTGAARESTPAAAPVVDILEALRRSLERKPAARESASGVSSPKPATAKKTAKHKKAGG